MRFLKSKIVQVLFIFVSVALLIWSFKGADLRSLQENLEKILWLPIFGFFILNLPILFFKTRQWKILLQPEHTLKMRRLFPLLTLWHMMDWLYPMKMGDASRLYLFKKREGVSYSKMISGTVVENLVDASSTIFLWVFLIGVMSRQMLFPGLLKAGLLFVLFIAALWTIAILFNRRLKNGLTGLILLELGIKGTEFLLLFGLQKILGIPAPWWAPILAISLINLALFLPVAPGRFGLFEAGGILAYLWLGVDKTSALSLILMFHLVQIVPATLMGLMAMAMLSENRPVHSPIST